MLAAEQTVLAVTALAPALVRNVGLAVSTYYRLNAPRLVLSPAHRIAAPLAVAPQAVIAHVWNSTKSTKGHD